MSLPTARPASPHGSVLSRPRHDVAGLPNEAFDDIIYFGADKATIELLNDKLAARGIINVVLGGRKIGQPCPSASAASITA